MTQTLTLSGAATGFSGRDHAKSAPRFGLLARLSDALRTRRNANRDSDIGHFIESHGGVMTDELERQISRQFGGMVR